MLSAILRHVGWYVVTDVSTECNAFFFTVDESKKTVLLNSEDEDTTSFKTWGTIHQATQRDVQEELHFQLMFSSRLNNLQHMSISEAVSVCC